MVYISCYLYLVTGFLCIQQGAVNAFGHGDSSYNPNYYGESQGPNENYNANTNVNSNTNIRRQLVGKRRSNYNTNQNVNNNGGFYRRLLDAGNRYYNAPYNDRFLKSDARRLQRALSKSRRSNLYRRNMYATDGEDQKSAMSRRTDEDEDSSFEAYNAEDMPLQHRPLQTLTPCKDESDSMLDVNAVEDPSDEHESRRFNRRRQYRRANSLFGRNSQNYNALRRRELAETEEAENDSTSNAENNDAAEEKRQKNKKRRALRKLRRANTRSKNVNTNQNYNSNMVAWREAASNRYNQFNPYLPGNY